MYYVPSFKSAVFFSCIFGISYTCHADAIHISLKKAMMTGLVSVNATSTGGAMEKSIKLNIENNTKKDLVLDIDPALIFKPKDTVYQNLVLLGNETLAVAAHSKADIRLQSYCGKKYGAGPVAGLSYNYWKQGDSNMIKTLCYVKENSVNNGLAQRAVWMYTNGYCLNSVYSSSDIRMSENFVKYLAALTKTPVPQYYTEYKVDMADITRENNTKDSKVYVTMHWGDVGYYRHMYLWVYKQDGALYKKVEADQVIDKDGVTVKVELDPKRDPRGGYIVQLHDDADKVWEEKKAMVGYSACDML